MTALHPVPGAHEPVKRAGTAHWWGRLPRQRRIRLKLSTMGLLALLSGLDVLAILVVVALVAEQVPVATAVRRWAIALLTLFGMNAAVLTLLAVAGLSWYPRLLVAAYLVVAGLVPERNSQSPLLNKFASASDGWALATAATAFIVLYRPFAGASTGRALAMMSYGPDSAAHLYLVQDIRQYGGYINLRAPVDGWSGMAEYPSAWAGNVALVVELLLNDERAIAPVISAITPLIIAGYALLVYFAGALVLDVVFLATGRISLPVGIFASGCVALAMLAGASIFLLQIGFYTQLVATASILAIVLVIAEQDGVRQLAVVCLLTITVMQTWYLLAPVLVAVLLVYGSRRRLRKRWTLGAAMPTALLSSYPILNGPSGSQINAVGGSPLPTIAGIVCLLLISLLGLVYLLPMQQAGRQLRLTLMAALVAALLLDVSILVFQVLTAGIAYYAIKILYSVFLLGVIAGIAAGAIALHGLTVARTPSVRRPRVAQFLSVAIVIVGLSVASYTTRVLSWPYLLGKAPGSFDDGKSLDALFDRHPAGLPTGTDAWMLDGCSRVTDFIGAAWGFGLSLSWNASLSDSYVAFAEGYNDPTSIDMLVARVRSAVPVQTEVYVHHDCQPAARKALSELPGVTVIFVQ